MPLFVATILIAAGKVGCAAPAGGYYTIQVVDEQTGRGVPLVELRTVNNVRYYTDSNGLIALDEPSLWGREVYFWVSSHGYEYPADGFGYRGCRLKLEPGGHAQIKLPRLNIAERLYRVTGEGIYRDSILTGAPVPTREPLLNALVFGQDSVINAVYHGQIYWFWGDTSRPSYPLGNFHVPGARSRLPADGGLDPKLGVDLEYFVDENGFARETAHMPGEGPTWIDGLTVLRGADGAERMFAAYAKIRTAMEVYERGLVEFDDREQRFTKVMQFAPDQLLYPRGHPFIRTADGAEYVYFATPYPLVRVRATPEGLQRPESYEAFTCLREGARADQQEVDRDPEGRVRWSWKRDTGVVGPQEQDKLVKAGVLQPTEALLQLRDVDSGAAVQAHSGSVYWNEYRRRWVMVALQAFGTSFLGEVWYAEGDTPEGPWVYARKIVTHNDYSFYNPKQDPMFDQEGGRVIFFEGTYASTFSGTTVPTPRYDYNQIMYRLDLDDARLALPVPVYQLSEAVEPLRLGTQADMPDDGRGRPVLFFAPDRPAAGTVPVYDIGERGGATRLRVGGDAPDPGRGPLFYALPAGAEGAPATTTPLYEFVAGAGDQRSYSADDAAPAGFTRTPEPICLVWRSPLAASLRWEPG